VIIKQFSEAELDKKVLKILKAKHKAQLHKLKPIDTTTLIEQLNLPTTQKLLTNMFASAIVNKSDIQNPISNNDNPIFITLNSGNTIIFNTELEAIGNYQIENITLSNLSTKRQKLNKLKNRNIVIAYFNLNQGISGKVRFRQSYLSLIKELSLKNKVNLVVFGSPYAIPKFKDFNNILLMHEDNAITQALAPNFIFGNTKATGTLPVQL